ncbi:uncharacterized protein [Periplaneta americana]|uniref:uncharacterized protein n=1 Tax=Periplaneta americana TaxID=6978 RepID=UPI0037E82A88
MATTETPISPPWVDKKRLELWLREYHGQVTVTDVDVEVSTAKGENYLSSIQRLKVTTEGGGVYRLLVKICLEEGASGEVMKNSSIYRREMVIYRDILPKMHALLQEALPDSFEPLAPRCYYACMDFLVMEDLTAAGFKMENFTVGLDLQRCLVIMRTIARFHAASVILHQRDPGCMKDFLVNFFHDPSIQSTWTRFFSGMATTLVEELDTWSDEFKKYADVLRRQIPDVMKLLQQTTLRDDSSFNVLTHSDLWVNNIQFSKDGSRARLVDFQFSSFGTPVLDLHYFLTNSVTMDVRMNHTDSLLQEYHNTLCDTLTALGYTQTLMTLEELHKEFDSKIYYAMFTTISPYALMQSAPQVEFSFEIGLRTGQNPGRRMYGDAYKKAVRWLLPYFESRGLFTQK